MFSLKAFPSQALRPVPPPLQTGPIGLIGLSGSLGRESFREAFLQRVLAVWAVGTEALLDSLGGLLGSGGAGCSFLPISPLLEKQDSSGTLE